MRDTQAERIRQLSIFYCVVAGTICSVAVPMAIIAGSRYSGIFATRLFIAAGLLAFAGPYYLWKGLRELHRGGSR
ncbi:MAG TPA: hypothetical protein VHZ24_00710 [Pirellulales bacterium]|jgi:high-affinity Fe2+/Pb2+ permease|nr:hypothetical protein [Pirellulales bacterium]